MALVMGATREEATLTNDRRMKVAQLRLAGVTSQDRIATILHVSVATISHDFAALDQLWREKAQEDIAAVKGMEVERIERLIGALWAAALGGKLGAVAQIIKLMEHKAKIYGLYAPVTVNIIQEEAKRLAREFGLDVTEILAEAERIVQGVSVVRDVLPEDAE